MIELEYPPLPPTLQYRKLGEPSPVSSGLVSYEDRDVDIFWKKECTPREPTASEYSMRLRAYVNTRQGIGYIRAKLKDVFSQKFDTPQEALNVVVMRLWLGEEG
jgi:hypothetical protein